MLRPSRGRRRAVLQTRNRRGRSSSARKWASGSRRAKNASLVALTNCASQVIAAMILYLGSTGSNGALEARLRPSLTPTRSRGRSAAPGVGAAPARNTSAVSSGSIVCLGTETVRRRPRSPTVSFGEWSTNAISRQPAPVFTIRDGGLRRRGVPARLRRLDRGPKRRSTSRGSGSSPSTMARPTGRGRRGGLGAPAPDARDGAPPRDGGQGSARNSWASPRPPGRG